jgi:hypothetical protein
MAGSKSTFIAGVLFLTSTCGAVAQSSLPKLEPEMARELFGVYAGCRAYWKVAAQCLPTGLDPKDNARLRQAFDRLQVVGVDHMKWLAEKGQLSLAMQQQISGTASRRVSDAAKGTCDTTPSLVQEYRDKCAALYKNVATGQKEVPSVDQNLATENAASAAKFIISTCYEPIDDVSRVGSYARMMKWRELSADQKNLLKPVDSTFFEAWEVDHDGLTYLVSVNRGHLKGRPTEVCQVSVPQNAEPIVARITGSVKTRTIGTNNNGTQINEMYELVSHPSAKSATLLVSRSTDNREFFTIAFMGIK